MSKIQISPENLEVATKYLETQSIPETAAMLCISQEKVADSLNKAEVKRFIDNIYLDYGYRNKFKLGALLDKIIEEKVEEAAETGMYTNKDLADLIKLAHTMRIDEQKASNSSITNQTNVQINSETPFGSGKYGKLMESLLGDTVEVPKTSNN